MEAGALGLPALGHKLGNFCSDRGRRFPGMARDLQEGNKVSLTTSRESRASWSSLNHGMAQGKVIVGVMLECCSQRWQKVKEQLRAQVDRGQTTWQCSREQGLQQAEAHVYDASEGVQRILWVGDMDVLISIHRQQLSAFLQIQYSVKYPQQFSFINYFLYSFVFFSLFSFCDSIVQYMPCHPAQRVQGEAK